MKTGIPCGNDCGHNHRLESAAADCRGTGRKKAGTGGSVAEPRYTTDGSIQSVTIGGHPWDAEMVEKVDEWSKEQAALNITFERDKDRIGPDAARAEYRRGLQEVEACLGLTDSYPEDAAVLLAQDRSRSEFGRTVVRQHHKNLSSMTQGRLDHSLYVPDRAMWEGSNGKLFAQQSELVREAYQKGQARVLAHYYLGSDGGAAMVMEHKLGRTQHGEELAAYAAGMKAAEAQRLVDQNKVGPDQTVLVRSHDGRVIRMKNVERRSNGVVHGWVVEPDGSTEGEWMTQDSAVFAVDGQR